MAEPEDRPQGQTQGPGGDDLSDQVVVEEAERLLDDIDQALARLEDGSFGTCEACGEPIEAERLTAQPTVRTCERHPQLTDPRRAP